MSVVLPPLDTLLVSGGDTRIALDPQTRLNRYGCGVRPDASLTSFASSTASTISQEGFATTQRLYLKLQRALAQTPAAQVYADELRRIRAELLTLCGLDDLPDTTIVLTPSGTDSHRLATYLASEDRAQNVLMVDAAETGRDVPAALGGCPTANARTSMSIALRQSDRRVRPAATIDADFIAAAEAAIARNERVLLVLADCTKTGLIAPSPACARDLRQRFADRLEVMVDACQFRIAPKTLCSYLADGFMVAITGSKFMGGPAFSGALLLPATLARRWHDRPVPAALADASNRSEWPSDWNATLLPDAANFGLLLRWEAALAGLRRFHALPGDAVTGFLQSFAQAITARLADDPSFAMLPVHPLDRRPLTGNESWDNVQTIYSFVLQRPAKQGQEQQPCSAAETERIYRQLMAGTPEIDGHRCQLGQPVTCGELNGAPVTALRLCTSAHLTIEALERPDGAARIIDRALQALDRVAMLAGTRPA